MNEEENEKFRKDVKNLQTNLTRKNLLSSFIIQLICNERWRGRTSVAPIQNALSYLGSCGGMSSSISRLLSQFRVCKSNTSSQDMRKHVKLLNHQKFERDMRIIGSNLIEEDTKMEEEEELKILNANLEYKDSLLIVVYDNWQKNKVVSLSNKVGRDSTHLQFIVGYYIPTQPSSIHIGSLDRINFPFNITDCVDVLERSSSDHNFIDQDFFDFFSSFRPVQNHSISVLDTCNIPPVTANSGSEKDIEEHIIEKLLIERMGAGLKPTITGSDREPSNLHQKITNKRLCDGNSDPIKNIMNVPGRMHLEMHIFTSLATHQLYYFHNSVLFQKHLGIQTQAYGNFYHT